MKRLILLSLIVGAGVYFGYVKAPPGGFSSGGTVAQEASQWFESIKTSFNRMAGNAPAETLAHSIGALSEKVLQPLDAEAGISTEEARQSLTAIQSNVATRQAEPDYRRKAQAVSLLAQAIEERDAYLGRLKTGTSFNTLEKVPNSWRMIHRIGEPQADRYVLTREARDSFWGQATLRQWRERNDYYKAAIAALLAQNTPH